ncbi:MAG: capsule assembly Wzi family protein [Candidatus Rariloculaceae bacterium]
MTLKLRPLVPLCSAICLLGLPPQTANGELLQPGDVRLRHEIQMLADAGVIDAPITGWPLFLAGVDLSDTDVGSLDPATADALQRTFPRRETHALTQLDLGVGGISEQERLRGFADVPRESGEVYARFAWEAGRFAGDFSATYVSDPSDGKEWRPDGSYIGVALGNWFVAASATDRWWGPGWDSSMALSNNARPIPAITIQRREARRTSIRWLRWIGPWTTQVIFSQMENDRHVPNTRFFGWRFGFKPLPKLEIGLTRTAQWCGEGRPCGFDTFVDLLTGVRDNPGQNVAPEDEPGNQLGGFDLRYSFNAFKQPMAVYSQWIGEDEQDGLPSGYLAEVGLETWNAWGDGGASYRVFAEYNEPTCSAITDSDPNFYCAYNHHIYEDGYRYRGRVIGHSADTDSVAFTLSGMLFTTQGHSWQLTARRAELNRSNDPRHSLTPVQQDIHTVELRHTRALPYGDLNITIGTEFGEVTATGADIDETRASIQWIWKLGGNY